MPTIQIKNVSVEAHETLHRRAATAHQSLQEYMLAQVEEQTARPTLGEVLAHAGQRRGGSLRLGDAAEAIRSDRDRR